MSTSRPPKHERPASTVSRSTKRVKEEGEEEEGSQNEMDWGRLKREEQRRGKKRENVEVDSSTEVGSVNDDDYDESDDDTVVQDEVISKVKAERKQQNKKKKKSEEAKSARTENDDSPSSKLSSINKKEKSQRQEYLKSIGTLKGKGKRIVDESEDREIGEEWTDLNGLKWKMGEDGQMRREAIMIEMKLKYPSMPKDSRHPDAKVKIPVHVERYLTEREYEEAREKKLLSHQELERQREKEEVEEAARKKQEEEEQKAREKRALESGRAITTPKKIRDIQALFSSARKPSSPSQHQLPFTISRSQSLNLHSSQPSTPAPSSVKRLSLSMGKDEAELATTPTQPPSPLTPKTTSKPVITPQQIKTPKSLPIKISYRLPLASPSSPSTTNITINHRSSPVTDITTKRKREANLLKLLQEEADRRKNREQVN